MKLGAAIHVIRERRQLNLSQLAKRTGLSEIYIRKLERGDRVNPTLETLEQIAAALTVRVDDLLRAAIDLDNEPENAHQVPVAIEIRDDRLEREELKQRPEYWIVLGDAATDTRDFRGALDQYRRAGQLMEQKDYTWARFTLDRLGQTLINLNDFVQLDRLIDLIGADYQEPLRQRHGHDDLLIHMVLEEKRTWRDIWLGDEVAAIPHAYAAYEIAQQGKVFRVEETGLHLAGRALVERPTTYLLYPKLFPHLRLEHVRARRDMEHGLRLLEMAGDMDRAAKQTYGEAFNAQWQARTLFVLGRTSEGLARQDEWLALLGNDPGIAEAKLDLPKLMLAQEDRHTAHMLAAAEEVTRETLATLKSWPYAPGMADAAITLAYIEVLRGKYSLNRANRSRGADLCLVAMCLHPYPTHPIFQVATRLLERFVWAMSLLEFDEYQHELPAWIDAREGEFQLLNSAFVIDEHLDLRQYLRTAWEKRP